MKLASTAVNSSNLPVDFAELPSAFKVGEDVLKTAFGGPTDSRGDWQIDYYDADGNKIGESFTFKDKWSGETVTSFNDANYNWLGDVRITPDVSKHVFTRSEAGTGANKQVTEVMSRSDWDGSAWVVKESSTFVFDNNFNLVSGEEVRNGVTTTYDANWEVTGTQADLSSMAGVRCNSSDLAAAIPGSTVTLGDIFPNAVKKTVESFADFYTGGTNDETTYYDADGNTLGRMNVIHSWTQSNKTFVNIHFG